MLNVRQPGLSTITTGSTTVDVADILDNGLARQELTANLVNGFADNFGNNDPLAVWRLDTAQNFLRQEIHQGTEHEVRAIMDEPGLSDMSRTQRINGLVGEYVLGAGTLSQYNAPIQLVEALQEVDMDPAQIQRALIGRFVGQILSVGGRSAIFTAEEWARQGGIADDEVPVAIVAKFGPVLNAIQRDQPDLLTGESIQQGGYASALRELQRIGIVLNAEQQFAVAA